MVNDIILSRVKWLLTPSVVPEHFVKDGVVRFCCLRSLMLAFATTPCAFAVYGVCEALAGGDA